MASQPSFFGTRSETSYDGQPTQPFQNTVLQDANPGATDALTITLNGSGSLQGAGLSMVSPSTYALPTGTPGMVTSYLNGITFDYAPAAPGTTNTTQFVLNDTSSAGTSASSGDFYATYVAPPPADNIALNSIDYADGSFTLRGQVTSYRGADHVLVSENTTSGDTSFSVPLAQDGSFAISLQDDLQSQGGTGFILYASQPSGNVTASTSAGIDGPISDEPYIALATTQGPDGHAGTRTSFFADGSRRVSVQDSGQTLSSYYYDTFANGGQPENTFVFDPGYGVDAVRMFRVGGSDHDTLSLSGSDFGNDVAEVLRNTTMSHGAAVITDPASGDVLRLPGVTKGQLAHNRDDFTFHG